MTYSPDILGDSFEQMTFTFANDYDGKVISTLVRLQSDQSTRAILYIHGYSDYFFQKGMAEKFASEGFNFYAIDLRKYGRSRLPHQRWFNVRDLSEYYEDIDVVLDQIKKEGNEEVTLLGHSTGGLVATLFAHDHANDNRFNKLILSSPFFEINKSWIEKKIGNPLVAWLGSKYPKTILKLPTFSDVYGKALHQSQFGENDYNLDWKPLLPDYVNLGWINAIYQGHQRVQKAVKINVPVLSLHSDKSYILSKFSEKAFEADIILNFRDIRQYSRMIEGDVQIKEIQGAIHDIALSREPARTHFYKTIFEYLH